MCFRLHKVQKLAKQTDGVKVGTLSTPGPCVPRWAHLGRNLHTAVTGPVLFRVCHTLTRTRLKRPPVLLPSRLPAEVSCISAERQLYPAAQDKIREAMPHAPFSHASHSPAQTCRPSHRCHLLAARHASFLVFPAPTLPPRTLLSKGSHSNRV